MNMVVMRSGILQRKVPVAITTRKVTINQDIRAFLIKSPNELLPEFLAAYLSYRQADLLRIVKYSATVQSINSEELEKFSVPLPPIQVQLQLIKRVDAGRAKVAKLKAEAKAILEAAKADVEAMILGTKPV